MTTSDFFLSITEKETYLKTLKLSFFRPPRRTAVRSVTALRCSPVSESRHSIEEQPGTLTPHAHPTASKPSISIARSRTLYCTSAVWHLAAPRLPTRTHVIRCVLAGPTGPGVARPPAAVCSFLYWKGEAPPPPGICACCFARAAQACETNAIASR